MSNNVINQLSAIVLNPGGPSGLPIATKALSFRTTHGTIVSDINLEIRSRKCTAILGHNGAGKSVLMRLLHGLLKPSSGSVQWGEETNVELARRSQAMVFQKPVLLRRSVEANIRFVVKHRGLRGHELDSEVASYLELGLLQALRHRPAHVLSGGEAQRLALVRALATKPSVLMLDEPTASLDPNATIAIEKILQRAIVGGVSLLLITQSLQQARRLADEVIFLHKGQVLEHSSVDAFFEKPTTREAQRFLGGLLS